MDTYIQVTTAIDDEDRARALARALVEEGVAACVQVVGPVSSTFRWRGKVVTEREWLLFVKTRGERYEDCAAAIRAHHPYELPEIVALPLVAGDRDYLAWVAQVSTPDGPSGAG